MRDDPLRVLQTVLFVDAEGELRRLRSSAETAGNQASGLFKVRCYMRHNIASGIQRDSSSENLLA